MALVIMIIIWIVIGLLIGALADPIWKGYRPYGLTKDYLFAIAAAVITGLFDWYILPLIHIEGTLRFVAALLEPPLGALAALWVMRLIKKQD